MNVRIASAQGPSLIAPSLANFDRGCGRPDRSRKAFRSKDSINSSSNDCNGRLLFIVVLARRDVRDAIGVL